ncbi:MAG: hypothetical protein HC786_20415 [Richelia sp. CSU_2_1]|nr:hypothetical protein [Richelia sp. CSU_2_1]
MQVKDLAIELKVTITALQERMLDSGIDPELDEIDSTAADLLRKLFNPSEDSVALPAGGDREPAKKARKSRSKKEGQIATTASSAVEQAAATSHQATSDWAQQVQKIEAMKGVAHGNQCAASYAVGFLSALTNGKQSFMEAYIQQSGKSLVAEHATFDPANLPKQMGVKSPTEYLGAEEFPLELDVEQLQISFLE